MEDYIPNVREPDVPLPRGTIAASVSTTLNPPDHPITITNPLRAEDFSDSPQGVAVYAATSRVAEFLSHGFLTPTNPSGPNRSLWLRTTSELVVYIHNSLRRTHVADTLPSVFNSLSHEESEALSLLSSTLSALSSFTTSYKANPEHWDICLCCLEECNLSIDNAPLWSVLMSTDQNIRAAHSTIINEAIRALSSEMEDWTDSRRAEVKTRLLEAILTDDASSLIPPDDQSLAAWITDCRANLRRAAKANINKEVYDETFAPWAIECVDVWRAEIDKRVQAEAESYYCDLLSSEKTKMRELADKELAIFRNQLEVETEECKAHARAASEEAAMAKSSLKVSKGCHRVNPVSGRRPSRSVSLSRPLSPTPPVSPASADALTPKAPPPATLPLVPDPMDHMPEPFAKSAPAGPAEDNLGETMPDVRANQATTAFFGPVCSPQGTANGHPSTALSPGPHASDIERIFAAQFATLSSQISSQISVLSSSIAVIEANRNSTAIPTPTPAPKSYSPSVPAASLDWELPQDDGDFNLGPTDDFDTEQARLAEEANAAAQRLDIFIEHLFRSINYIPADAALSAKQQSIVFEDYTDAFRAFCERMGLDESVPFEDSLIPAFNAYLPTFWREKEQKARAAATSLTIQHHSHGTMRTTTTTMPLLPSRAPSLPPVAQTHPCPDPPASISDPDVKGWTQVGPKGKIARASYATAAATTKTTRPHPTTPANQAKTPAHPAPAPPTLSRIHSRAQLNKMSREDLLSLLRLCFNCTDKISPTLDKSFIVDSILARAAKETPSPKPKPKACPLQTTEFTVIRPTVPSAPPEHHQAADLIVRTLKTRMQLQHGRNSPLPVTLLSGRWSSQSSPNFVLIFSGQPSSDVMIDLKISFSLAPQEVPL